MFRDTHALEIGQPDLHTGSADDDRAIAKRVQAANTGRWRNSGNGRYRVVLYSHDTMGLGHIRRNILLSQILSDASPNIDILLISGAREAAAFKLPGNVDLVALPAYRKTADGTYDARNLGVGLDQLSEIRSQIIFTTIESFQPHLVIVDNVARGVNGELDCTLDYIRRHDGIRCILGLRDIQDEPENLQREWKTRRCLEAIREHYDSVWVYGEARIFDPRKEYNLPADIAYKFQFTGYLDPSKRIENALEGAESPDLGDKPFGLCLVGGGQDGAALAQAYAHSGHPRGMNAVIVTGPYMDADILARLKLMTTRRPHLKVLEFVREPTRILRDAEYVVCMGGYNTVCEVIAFDKPALIVPRIVPRREQIVRAERLQQLGIVDMLHPDSLNPDTLTHWISGLAQRAVGGPRQLIDMNAARRIPSFFHQQVRQLDSRLGCISQLAGSR